MLGNWFKTGLLMAAIMALFGMVGGVLGGGQGMLLALLFVSNLYTLGKLNSARQSLGSFRNDLYKRIASVQGLDSSILSMVGVARYSAGFRADQASVCTQPRSATALRSMPTCRISRASTRSR